MPSLSLFRRVPAFDFEGVGVRRRRRRKKVVGILAFMLALGAVCGTVLAWAMELGFEDILRQGIVQLAG